MTFEEGVARAADRTWRCGPPQHLSGRVEGGLRAADVTSPPSRILQWRMAMLRSARERVGYRCGGSAGLSPASRYLERKRGEPYGQGARRARVRPIDGELPAPSAHCRGTPAT